MSKIAVGVCAFLAGVCFATLTNISARSVAAAVPAPQVGLAPSNRNVFHGGGINGGRTGVNLGGAIPQFVPLEQYPIFEDFTISNTHQPLDGLDCRNCKFENASLRYSGGAFNLTNAAFSGTTSLVLEGAAANTVAFLQLMQGVAKGIPVPSLPPNRPVNKRATAKKPLTKMDFTAPFIGTK